MAESTVSILNASSIPTIPLSIPEELTFFSETRSSDNQSENLPTGISLPDRTRQFPPIPSGSFYANAASPASGETMNPSKENVQPRRNINNVLGAPTGVKKLFSELDPPPNNW